MVEGTLGWCEKAFVGNFPGLYLLCDPRRVQPFLCHQVTIYAKGAYHMGTPAVVSSTCGAFYGPALGGPRRGEER